MPGTTPKLIAYYLPQYHEIPENNEWWGKGFTEWTNLRKAVPLYEGHRILEPLGNNYYDLMDKATVEWQSDLARTYSVYGFNYYHYWMNGRKILERPAENLLRWKEIDQNFMFMWANHDWTRSWVGKHEVLLKMTYGGEEEWGAHLSYLMGFFMDPRYIKIGNRPVFQVYSRRTIPRFDEMVAFWDDGCRRKGFDGIYILDNIDYEMIRRGEISKTCSAVTLQEHSASVQYQETKSGLNRLVTGARRAAGTAARRLLGIRGAIPRPGIKRYSYDDNVAASIALMKKLDLGLTTFFGVCTGWDNTPRYGRRGYVVEGATPQKFQHYIAEAMRLSEARGQEFIFVACWNEWCEGMCLEPTKQDGYGYLEAVRSVFGEPVMGGGKR
jgi:hypothetical protein